MRKTLIHLLVATAIVLPNFAFADDLRAESRAIAASSVDRSCFRFREWLANGGVDVECPGPNCPGFSFDRMLFSFRSWLVSQIVRFDQPRVASGPEVSPQQGIFASASDGAIEAPPSNRSETNRHLTAR